MPRLDKLLSDGRSAFHGTLWRTVTLGEYDPTYGTYVVLDGITAESYLADPMDEGVKEGAAVHLLGELEYMGQTEPLPSTEPTGTGEAPSETASNPVEEPAGAGSGSLVTPTEDPEKQ